MQGSTLSTSVSSSDGRAVGLLFVLVAECTFGVDT